MILFQRISGTFSFKEYRKLQMLSDKYIRYLSLYVENKCSVLFASVATSLWEHLQLPRGRRHAHFRMRIADIKLYIFSSLQTYVNF
jgi:hypothetical protein